MGAFIGGTDKVSKQYGQFIRPKYMTDKEMREEFKHSIHLFTKDSKMEKMNRLIQINNLYKHSHIDRHFNMLNMIETLKSGLTESSISYYILSQNIRFRLEKGGKVFILPFIKFIFNYNYFVSMYLLGIQPTEDHIWNPPLFTNGAIMTDIFDRLIRDASAAKCNHAEICDQLGELKYYFNLICYKCGDRLGLSMSNNELLELARRNPEIDEMFRCNFKYPKDAQPDEIEQIRRDKTAMMLKIMSKEADLSISNYARNGLINAGQLTEYAIQQGFKPGLRGETLPLLNMTNIIMGINDIDAYVIDAIGGRKAEIEKDVIQEVISLERAALMSTSRIRTVDNNPKHFCHSRNYRIRYIDSMKTLEGLDGRVVSLTDPNKTDNPEFIIIDADAGDKYNLIGKTIYMKTPLTCAHPLRSKGVICAACYGVKLARMNSTIHIGRLSAFHGTHRFAQNQMSAKHMLTTHTVRIQASDNFDKYFQFGNTTISFNPYIKDMIDRHEWHNIDDEISNYYLVFDPAHVDKTISGSGTFFNSRISDIGIIDSRKMDINNIDMDRVEKVTFSSTLMLFLDPEIEVIFEDYKRTNEVVIIPFVDLRGIDFLFSYLYLNNEMASPIREIRRMIVTGNGVKSAENNFNKFLDMLIPLYHKGNVYLPEIHIEMLTSGMIIPPDGKSSINWEDEEAEYELTTIYDSNLKSPSVVTSLQFSKVSAQVMKGINKTYEKDAVSDYDYFL